MTPNPILVISTTGKTGRRVGDAFGCTKSNALFEEFWDGRTAV